MIKSIFLIFFSTSLYFSEQNTNHLLTECSTALEVVKVTNTKNNLSNGQIEVKITSLKSFICTISKVVKGGIEKIEEKKGSGNQNVVFENLSGKEYYRISIFFTNSENIECSQIDTPSIAVY